MEDLIFGHEAADVQVDAKGKPVGCYGVEEIFDELDNMSIGQFGEEYRKVVNARREQWNKDGVWHFEVM